MCKPPRRAGSSLVSHVGTGSLGRCSTKGSHPERHGPSSPCSSGQCAGMGHAVLMPGVLTAPILLPPGWSCFSLPSAGCTIGGSAEGSSASCSSQICSQHSQDGQEALLPPDTGSVGQVVGKKWAVGVAEGYPVSACRCLGMPLLRQCRERAWPAGLLVCTIEESINVFDKWTVRTV